MSDCEICDVLGDLVDWGESVSVEPLPANPPPEVGRLEPVAEHVFRCPICGRLYERDTASVTFLNNDYDSEYVRRLRPDEYPPAQRDSALARLRADLNATDANVRLSAAKTVVDRKDYARDLMTSGAADVRRLAVFTLGNLSMRSELEALLSDSDGSVRMAAGQVLASSLLRKQADDANALLEKTTGEAYSGVLKAFFMADAAATLPLLERQQEADPKYQVPSEMLSRLGELLPSSEVAWRILTVNAERGGEIRSTLPAFARQLGCRHASLADIVTDVIHKDLDTKPLVRWLSLLAYSEPDEALHALTDLHDRGQNIDGATGTLQRLDAKSLLESINAPSTRKRESEFASLAAGHLTIGGGQAPEWVIYGKDGGLRIEYRFGDHGDVQPISEGRVRSILARKAYTWKQART